MPPVWRRNCFQNMLIASAPWLLSPHPEAGSSSKPGRDCSTTKRTRGGSHPRERSHVRWQDSREHIAWVVRPRVGVWGTKPK